MSGQPGYRFVRVIGVILVILFGVIHSATAQSPGIKPQEAQSITPTLPERLRIEDVVREVLQYNDRIAAARFMEKAAFDEIGPAGAWDDPMLMVGVVNLPTNFDFKADMMTMKMIGLSQNIPYAGQKGLQAKAARAEALAAREAKRNTEIDLSTAAKFAYFDLYYRQAILEYVKNQQSLQQQVMATATAKLRTDQASQADVAAAQADLWRLEADLLSSEQEVESARNDLLSLMGRNQGTELPNLAEPNFPAIPETPDAWNNLARENYPPLRQLKYQQESYLFSKAAARRMRWPMLNLSADYGFRESTPMEKRDNMVSFEATLSIPVFQGHQQNNMARSMEAMSRSAELEASQMVREIQAGIATLHSKAKRLAQSLKLYREQIIPADQDALTSALTGYSSNRVPFINLLTYAGSIYSDRITAARIELELARTMAEVEKYITEPDIWNIE